MAYLKEVESPYAVLDFIRSYLGDTVEAKEFAKQFLERRAKQKANQQRQQQQVGLSVWVMIDWLIGFKRPKGSKKYDLPKLMPNFLLYFESSGLSPLPSLFI